MHHLGTQLGKLEFKTSKLVQLGGYLKSISWFISFVGRTHARLEISKHQFLVKLRSNEVYSHSGAKPRPKCGTAQVPPSKTFKISEHRYVRYQPSSFCHFPGCACRNSTQDVHRLTNVEALQSCKGILE